MAHVFFLNSRCTWSYMESYICFSYCQLSTCKWFLVSRQYSCLTDGVVDGERCLGLVLLNINMWEQRNFGDFSLLPPQHMYKCILASYQKKTSFNSFDNHYSMWLEKNIHKDPTTGARRRTFRIALSFLRFMSFCLSFLSQFHFLLIWFITVKNWIQMSGGGAPSRYVKLTKEQAPVDEVNPGELNQPIQVPQLSLSLSLYWSDYGYYILVFNCLRSRM